MMDIGVMKLKCSSMTPDCFVAEYRQASTAREMDVSHVKWSQRILNRNLPCLLFHRYGPSNFGLFSTQTLTDSIFSCFLSSLMVLQPRD